MDALLGTSRNPQNYGGGDRMRRVLPGQRPEGFHDETDPLKMTILERSFSEGGTAGHTGGIIMRTWRIRY
jgi:hypothetical protein